MATSNSSTTQPNWDTCGFAGNPDLYGLGVRLGLYFTLLASFISPVTKGAYKKHLQVTIFVLCLSTIIVIFRESVRRTILGVEVDLLTFLLGIQLLFAGGIMDLGEECEEDPTNIIFSVLTYILRLSWMCYLVWFAFRGLDVLPRPDCPDSYTFFFAKVSIYNWFRKLFEVASCLGVVTALFPFNLGIVGVIVSAPFALPLCILGPELSLKWNKISNVYTIDTVSQLVPFILGLGQLVLVIYKALTDSEKSGNGNVPPCEARQRRSKDSEHGAVTLKEPKSQTLKQSPEITSSEIDTKGETKQPEVVESQEDPISEVK